MSSYHVLNAIWVGVFPMLAASILIGVACYIICCLNQLKLRIIEYRREKKLLKAQQMHEKRNSRRKHKSKSRNHDYDQEDEFKTINEMQKKKPSLLDKLYEDEDEEDDDDDDYDIDDGDYYIKKPQPKIYSQIKNVARTKPPSAPPSPPQYSQNLSSKNPRNKNSIDRNRLSLKLKSNNNNNTNSLLDIKEESFGEEFPRFTPSKESDSLGAPSSKNSPLIVQELNESPKSALSRYQTLTRMGRQKELEKNLKPVDNLLPKYSSSSLSSDESNLSVAVDNYSNNNDNNINNDKNSSQNSDTENDYDDDYETESDKNKKSTDDRKKLAKKNNNFNSDLDLEDNLFFNDDDDDSLSSAASGGAGRLEKFNSYMTKTNYSLSNSSSARLNQNNHNIKLEKLSKLKSKKKLNEESVTTIKSNLTSGCPTAFLENINYIQDIDDDEEIDDVHKDNTRKKSLSDKSVDNSMSDIEPDENIVKDLLVKSPQNTKILASNIKINAASNAVNHQSSSEMF
jgi:hypothetical protein